MTEKVCLVGSGNWGSAIATKLGKNALEKDMFDSSASAAAHLALCHLRALRQPHEFFSFFSTLSSHAPLS